MCEIKYHVKLPIFIARQWIRHRTANVNEYSARYSILDKEFYIPTSDHLAAQSRFQPSILNPPETISINSFGTATVLECAKEAKVKRLVYSSSSSAYGNNPYPNVETQINDCLIKISHIFLI